MQLRIALLTLLLLAVWTHGLTKVETAVQYGTSMIGTRYGWWTGGTIPTGAPAWAQNGSPPNVTAVKNQSCFCAGLANLMLRKIGRTVPVTSSALAGGTLAYGKYYASKAQKFNLTANYPRGTLLGRYYRSVSDQGHVAVVVSPGRNGVILQSSASAYLATSPGINNKTTLYKANTGNYFEYAVLPGSWLY
eukprot:TRINITY_DN6952_c0_g1_i1.p1 TRINITY_DN6952_c0_g1~~TRINITY_DN6952_c0_g1_i1.p1  ORF type:complete len:191 (+),score=24.17 TRINITY_DN6952_c0_g1_i1:48-620(+)